MYVDYEYYIDVYGGDVKCIPEENFMKAVKWSEAYIRSLTYFNGDVFKENSLVIKNAVCAVAEVYSDFEKERAGIKKSESTDGYSVSYVTEQTDGEIKEGVLKRKAYAVARMHLLPTGWLSIAGRCLCDY